MLVTIIDCFTLGSFATDAALSKVIVNSSGVVDGRTLSFWGGDINPRHLSSRGRFDTDMLDKPLLSTSSQPAFVPLVALDNRAIQGRAA